MRLWYLSHRRPAKAQVSLRIRTVSPEPSLFAHMKYGRRRRVWPKIRQLAPLDGCACVFEEWVYGGQKVPWSHEMAQITASWISPIPSFAIILTKPLIVPIQGVSRQAIISCHHSISWYYYFSINWWGWFITFWKLKNCSMFQTCKLSKIITVKIKFFEWHIIAIFVKQKFSWNYTTDSDFYWLCQCC